VELLGVLAGQFGQPHDGVLIDTDQPARLANATAIGQVLQDGQGLVPGEARIEQGGGLAFGEAGLAGPAVEQTVLLVAAVVGTDGEVVLAPLAVQGAVGVLAAEAAEVVHG